MVKSVKYWFNVIRDSIKLWLDRNAFSYAGSLAFYTLFSLAPTVIIAVTVVGLWLGEDAARGEIVARLQDTLGPAAAKAIEDAVAQSSIQASGILPTVAGFVTLLIGATTVFGQMQFSLNTIWGVAPNPDRNSLWLFAKKRLLSLAVVLAIGFVLLVSLVLGVIVQATFSYAGGWVPGSVMLLELAQFALSLAVVTLFFAAIFKVLPDVVLSYRDVFLGALVTAVLFMLGRNAIAAYLAHTATASTYGAAGSVVLVLLWVYYSSLILLYGAAFTRTHVVSKGRRVIPRNTAVLVRHEVLHKETVEQEEPPTPMPMRKQQQEETSHDQAHDSSPGERPRSGRGLS
ncbi:YihY/virulence factor BrkB family protein [Salinicola sp. JS01]|uniref:YihY/virulence factor BrkB family protein n=1 Tax=Salinicola sp. JS01 TaxID=3050071 RepID=UPI00255B428A|nr:YihY/virulence factor BrkB family protein [Salinicola sp. JS01]WIX34627.1 YihY/virulence factor BrkB family protein [Salinicola sp. JS01]